MKMKMANEPKTNPAPFSSVGASRERQAPEKSHGEGSGKGRHAEKDVDSACGSFLRRLTSGAL